MNLAWRWNFALVLGALGSAVVGCKAPVNTFGGASTPPAYGSPPQNPVAKAWKSTSETVASALTIKTKTTPANDPTSLGSKPAKVSANTHIATGRLLESRQDFTKAQDEYEKAIVAEPTNLTALVSLARLQDRQGRPDQAVATYHKALKAHPASALVHNDLGLCYARKRDLASAVSLLNKAVEMEPTKPNYRNNLATVLVEAGRTDEALKHLQAVHSPAEAHFNVAYLLNHRGQVDVARRHLAQAVSLDPAFAPAQEMLARLDANAAGQAAVMEQPQMAASSPALTRPQTAAPATEAFLRSAASGAGAAYQDDPAESEMPPATAEPVYHIGSEGIESSPAQGPSVHQPTSHEYPGGPFPGATSFHLDDDGADAVLVATHLIYGADTDAPPEPAGLVDDEGSEEIASPAEEEEAAAEPTDGELSASKPSEEPTNVKPVSKLPTLYPIAQ